MLALWLRSFIATLAIEVPIFVLLAGRDVSRWRAAFAGAAGTCLTHPTLWFVWPRVVRGYAAFTITGELAIAVIETVTFFLLARPRSLLNAVAASFLANGASYALGGWLRQLGLLG